MTKCDQVLPSLSLWPLILTKAEFAVAEYLDRGFYEHSGDSIELGQSDAIFQLLVDYGPNILSRESDSSAKPTCSDIVTTLRTM